jgi:hypothetical protein
VRDRRVIAASRSDFKKRANVMLSRPGRLHGTIHSQEDLMQNTARFFPALSLSVSLAFGAGVLAAQRPADATGECKDGTFTTAASKSGACSGHGGVKTWFADDKGVKEKTKAVGKATGDAAKATGSATKDAAKDVAGATKTASKATAKGAEAAGSATKDAAATTGKATAKGATAAAGATKDATTKVAHVVARPASAEKDATGKCKDGTFTHAKQHSGACSGHGGVEEWYQ